MDNHFMRMNIAEEPIEIILDELDNSEVRNRNSLIFRDKMDQLLEKIAQKTRNVASPQLKPQDLYVEHQEDEKRGGPTCFLINGARGAGKSTLLRAVRDALVNPVSRLRTEKTPCLYSLADIDPTELGKEENFFLYVLARIYRVLEEQFRNRSQRDAETKKIQEAMEFLRKMSGGLSKLVDTDAALARSENPDFFLEERLEKCADSTIMRRTFSKLLDKVSEIVRYDFFLVTIDDADLNFSKCEDVFEYVRKYMQSPRLIFLFAGDMQLYIHIVRGMYMSHFRVNQLQYDKMYEASREQMLDDLVDQYLKKLFPVDSHVQLDSPKTILAEKKSLLFKRHRSDKQGYTFPDFLITYARPLIQGQKRKAFLDTLYSLHLRSFFSFMQYLGRQNESLSAADSLKYIGEGLHEEIAQALVKYNVDYKQLDRVDVAGLKKVLFRFCAGAQLWNSDLSMLSAEADSDLNRVALYLSGVIELNTQSLSDKLRYWCACFPAWQAVRDLFAQTHDGHQAKGLLDTCLERGNSNRRSNYANLACSAMAQPMDAPLLYGRGTICLLNEDRKCDKESGRSARRGMISLIRAFKDLKEKGGLEEQMFIFAFDSCLCRVDDPSGSYYYLSVYHLLMQAAELLSMGARERSFDEKEEKALIHSVGRELAAMRIVPTTQRLRITEGKALPETRRYHAFSGVENGAFVKKNEKWLNRFADTSFVSSAAEFSRSWEMFLAQCSALTASYQSVYEQEDDCPRAGYILQKYMTAVENALSRIQREGESSLYQCITSYPLWEILKNPPEKCMELLNSAYLGDVIDLRIKQKIGLLRMEWQRLMQSVTELAASLEDEEKKLAVDMNLLQELKQQVEADELKYHLCKEKLDEAEKKKEEHDSKLNSAMTEEENALLHLAELQSFAKNKEEACQSLQKKMQWLAVSMTFAITEDMQQLSISELMSGIRKKYSHVKNTVSRRRLEEFEKSIQEGMSLFSPEELCMPLVFLYGKVQNEKNSMEHKLKEDSLLIEQQKARVHTARRYRYQADKKLEEANAHVEEEKKSANEARSTYEISMLRLKQMERSVDRKKSGLDTLKQNKSAKQKECDEAKQAYEDAKKPDEQA